VFDTILPDAVRVADPFHLVKLANQRLDEVRRRVQNEMFGHRGHRDDPLYRARRLLTRADERLNDRRRSKLLGLLGPGDPRSEVRTAWHHCHVSNGPTEAANNLVKRAKRVAFGMTNFTNYRIRALLCAGKPNWDLLPTITPR
jgi:transposase